MLGGPHEKMFTISIIMVTCFASSSLCKFSADFMTFVNHPKHSNVADARDNAAEG